MNIDMNIMYDNFSKNEKRMQKRIDELQQENQKLKKQLHEASLTIQEMTERDIWCPSSCDKLEKLITQQQEFIKYLEDCITELGKGSMNKIENALNLGIIDITKTILQKYKEIIGGNSEESNNISS